MNTNTNVNIMSAMILKNVLINRVTELEKEFLLQIFLLLAS